MRHTHNIDSESEGCWTPVKNAGDVVRKGELIGVLRDYFGNIIEEVRLQEDCIILYQTISYSVPKDSPLIAYGHYDTCVDEIDQDSHTHEHHHGKKHMDMASHDLWEEIC